MTEPTAAPLPTEPTAALPDEAIRRFAQIRETSDLLIPVSTPSAATR